MQTISSTQKLAQLIEELSRTTMAIATTLQDVANVSKEKTAQKKESSVNQNQSETAQDSESSGEKLSITKVSIEDVRKVLAEKSEDGKLDQVKALLTSFGAERLSEVPPDKLSELLDAAKDLK